tara:strand:+ start:7755 stop:7928 length:174 start_codon:yes stop_codon:yes gene_type:complete
MTFDGKASRVSVNGKFVAEKGDNPYLLKGGLFKGKTDFTLARSRFRNRDLSLEFNDS